MKIFKISCTSFCAIIFGYFIKMAETNQTMVAPAVFAFCTWLAFFMFELIEGGCE